MQTLEETTVDTFEEEYLEDNIRCAQIQELLEKKII